MKDDLNMEVKKVDLRSKVPAPLKDRLTNFCKNAHADHHKVVAVALDEFLKKRERGY